MKQIKTLLIVISIAAVIGIGGLGYLVMQTSNALGYSQSRVASLNDDIRSIQDNFNQTTQSLRTSEAELTSTTITLSATHRQLSDREKELIDTKKALDDTQTSLTSTKTELAVAKDRLSKTTDVSAQLTAAQSQLQVAQTKLADAQQTLNGLGITIHTQPELWTFNSKDWPHNNNPTAVSPTWNQLKSFITRDDTDLTPYDKSDYNCVNYATRLYNAAELANIDSSMVTITLQGEVIGHALNAFITSDYGLVYIDCSSKDLVAHITVGQPFRAVDLTFASPGDFRNDTWWKQLESRGGYYYLPSSNPSLAQSIIKSISFYY
jgi:hypothetical protein